MVIDKIKEKSISELEQDAQLTEADIKRQQKEERRILENGK